MAGATAARIKTSAVHRGPTEPRWVRYLLTAIAVAYLLVFLALPLGVVFAEALAKGIAAYGSAVVQSDALSALKLTLIAAAIAVPLNLVFGIAAGWTIAKFDFPGKGLLTTLIDLPFAVSPVISGMIFVLLFGRTGVFGTWLADHDLKVIFSLPGIVIATVFVTFPFVAREVIPVLEATGTEEEEAARVLGAGGFQTVSFTQLTLATIALL
jgi:sulfate transport system permease protein